MKRAAPELMTGPNGSEDLRMAIRRLEWWHRVWEINNRERLAFPTFASWDDVTHDHDWESRNAYQSGALIDQCLICRVYRPHVEGTLSRQQKLYRLEDEAKRSS